MQAAVRNYSAYQASDEAWMLGRFIVPVQRLAEFSTAFKEACCDEQMSPWLLSVLGTSNAEEDTRFIESFSEGAAFLDSMEIKVIDAEHAEQSLGSIPSGMTAYIEFAPQQCGQVLPVLKKQNARAKLRTGGTTADVIPTVQEIAGFLLACAKAKVAFKATAGLHHPLRSTQKLTYEENSASSVMHGFINLFVAATVAYYASPQEEVIELLNEQSPSAFRWEKDGLKWRSHRFSAKQIKAVREKFAIGFGSCSFTEPIHDLKALGWL